MGIYVYGYTDLIGINTKVYEARENSFENDKLYDIIISSVLKDCGYNSNTKLKDNVVVDGFRLIFNENGAVLLKEDVSRGYIYNSKKEKPLYSFFYKKVTVEDPKLNFIDELKMKISSRPVDIPFFKFDITKTEPEEEKVPFQVELEKEINMRRSRASKRIKKLDSKRKKRLGLV